MQIISKKEFLLVDCLEEVANNYLKKIRGIERLSNLIERLVLQLKEIDKNYRNLLFDCWCIIEEEYAFMLADEKTDLDEEDKKIVNNAINEIVRICGEIKKYYKYEEDPLSWPYSDDVW